MRVIFSTLKDLTMGTGRKRRMDTAHCSLVLGSLCFHSHRVLIMQGQINIILEGNYGMKYVLFWKFTERVPLIIPALKIHFIALIEFRAWVKHLFSNANPSWSISVSNLSVIVTFAHNSLMPKQWKVWTLCL